MALINPERPKSTVEDFLAFDNPEVRSLSPAVRKLKVEMILERVIERLQCLNAHPNSLPGEFVYPFRLAAELSGQDPQILERIKLLAKSYNSTLDPGSKIDRIPLYQADPVEILSATGRVIGKGYNLVRTGYLNLNGGGQ